MTKKIITIIVFLFCITLSSCGKGRGVTNDQDSVKSQSFKVIGYMFTNGNLDTESAKIDFDKITHLNIAFINPDAAGTFTAPEGLAAAVKRAQQKKVKVLFSFAGGSPPAYLKNLLKPGNRPLLVSNMIAFADKYDFDGIDVDLEGDFIDSNYEAFIIALSDSLKPRNKLLSAAVATWNGNTISDRALRLFDFINVMSYDNTGPWNKQKPGPHATYESAVRDFNYWNTGRSVLAKKITLGLPFYGYGFGPDIQESFSYKDIVILYPGAENADSISIPQKGSIYYNGMLTIKKKVDFVVGKKAGGVMIWHLFADAAGANSLLSVIDQNKQ